MEDSLAVLSSSRGGSSSREGWGADGPVARGLYNIFFLLCHRDRDRERQRERGSESEGPEGAGWVVVAAEGGEERRWVVAGGGVILVFGMMDLGSGGSRRERERERELKLLKKNINIL